MIYLCDIGTTLPIEIHANYARIGSHYAKRVGSYRSQRLYRLGKYTINFDTNTTSIVIHRDGKTIQGDCRKTDSY